MSEVEKEKPAVAPTVKDEFTRLIAETVLATGEPVEVVSGGCKLYTVHPGGRVERTQ